MASGSRAYDMNIWNDEKLAGLLRMRFALRPALATGSSAPSPSPPDARVCTYRKITRLVLRTIRRVWRS